MREELSRRVGRREQFRATFGRFGLHRSPWGKQVTVLLLNVKDADGRLVADHMWFKRGRQMQKMKLRSGDQLRFTATIAPYTKRRNRDDECDHESRYVVDYRLIFPNNMRLIGQNAGTLPLFDAQQRPEAS